MDDLEWMQAREDASIYMKNRNTKIIDAWCSEAHVTSPVGYYNDLDGCITVFTDCPGALIGRAGTLVEKYKIQFNEEFHKDYKINFIEVRGGFANIHS